MENKIMGTEEVANINEDLATVDMAAAAKVEVVVAVAADEKGEEDAENISNKKMTMTTLEV